MSSSIEAFRLVLELKSELKAKEKNHEYYHDLLKHDPFDWFLELDVEVLEAEIQELKKAICATEMQQCG